MGERFIMNRNKPFYLILGSIFVITAFIFTYVITQIDLGASSESITEQVRQIRDTNLHNRLSQPYGKIEVPAEVYIGLVQSDNPKQSVEIAVSAVSLIPVHSGKIVLLKPLAGIDSRHEEVLWSETPDDFVDETFFYEIGYLPEGKHQFAAAFEFEPDSDKSQPLVVTGALYLDVRDTEILSSNVSFDQIKRVELYKELEKRVMADMKPQLSNADLKTLSEEMAVMESIEPDIVKRKIQELIETDPDVARRIQEINTFEEGQEKYSEQKILSDDLQPELEDTVFPVSVPMRFGPPAYEEEVPIPEEFRN